MMNDASHRYMLLAKIGNEYATEDHITEIDHRTAMTDIVEWVKSRNAHLDDELRNEWRQARIYLLDAGDTLSVTDRQHVLTIYVVRTRRGGDHYETIVERFINLSGARKP